MTYKAKIIFLNCETRDFKKNFKQSVFANFNVGKASDK
jgi:hypothetical protein